MTSPRFGWRYRSALPGGKAREFVVLSEDLWNERMSDAVIVPVFESDAKESLVRVAAADGLVADCTRPVNVHTEFLGAPVARCDEAAMTKIRIGVRIYLDVDRRESGKTVEPKAPRSDWWPRQGDFHFASNPQIGPHDKLYASVTDNDWSSREQATYTAAVRLTSKTKPSRRRWEVAVGDSFVVAGDLYLISYHRFEHKPPPPKYPQRMDADTLAELARSQKRALSLA